jgi:hypothetical protein
MFWPFMFIGFLIPSVYAAETAPVQPEKKFGIKNPDFKIEPYAQLQGWAVHSLNRASQNDSDPGLDGNEARTNFFFRRARLGFRSRPYKDLSYTLSLYYDNAGHDSLANTRASTLPVTSSGRSTDVTKTPAAVGLWDSFLTWKASSSDIAHLTFGYFRPQISRESITAAFNVNSFEKAPSQNYVRQAVIGRGFGRATGINLGGMKHEEKFGINYNVGIFNKVTTGDKYTPSGATAPVTLGETQGSENSLVYVGRVAFTFGDAEMEKYGLGYNINYFGKRKGITVAVNGSTQDSTPIYRSNKVIGGDILFNYGAWNIDGEYFYIYYKGDGMDKEARSRTGHFRIGHNFFLNNGTVIEPAAMVSGFFGEENAEFTGRDTVYDVGVNWYLDQNRYKFYLHYVMQDGDGSNLVHKDGSTGYHYGDYAGLGVTLQF